MGGLGALTGCGGGDPRTGGAGSTTTTTAGPAAGLAAYDPDVDYWRQGAFAPVDEETTVTDLPVTATTPSGLSGLYVRNGSNAPANSPSPTTAPPTHRTWRSSTPRTWAPARSPASTCRCGCPSASTVSGSPSPTSDHAPSDPGKPGSPPTIER